MSTEVDWAAVGYVKSSAYREDVLRALVSDGPDIPTRIQEKAGYERLSHVSRALRQLADEGLIECKTPARKKGRVYAPTEEGQTVLSNMGGA